MARTFYWLKLKKDFFKRHDIRILEKMPDGHEMLLLYIKLLVESLDHDGCLRFSDRIPYTPSMLSAVMDVSEQTAENALKALIQLGLVEIDKDQTIRMLQLHSMIGCESEWAEKKRKYREGKENEDVKSPLESEDIERTSGGQSEDKVRTSRGQKEDMSDKSIEFRVKSLETRVKKDKSNDLSIKREREEKEERERIAGAIPPPPSPSKTRFVRPSLEEVREYCEERKNGIDAERFISYYDSVGWRIGGKAPMKDWRACIRVWEKRDKTTPAPRASASSAIPIMENSYSKEELDEKEQRDLDEILGGDFG